MFITVSVTADALTLNASLRPSMMLALALSHEMLLFILHLGLLVNNFFNLLYFYGMQISSNYILQLFFGSNYLSIKSEPSQLHGKIES